MCRRDFITVLRLLSEPVGHCHCSPGGLLESPHHSRNASKTVASVCLPWSCGEWKGGVLGWNILSKPDLLVFSSPKLGPLDSGMSNRMVFSSVCSPKTLSVSFELGDEVGLAGWIGASELGSAIFLFQKLWTQRCNRIYCITLVRCNQINIMKLYS